MYERVTVQPVSKADFLFTRVTSRDVMRIRMHMTQQHVHVHAHVHAHVHVEYGVSLNTK